MESIAGEDLPPIRSAANRVRIAWLVTFSLAIDVASRFAVGLAIGAGLGGVAVFYLGYVGDDAPFVLAGIVVGPAIAFGALPVLRLFRAPPDYSERMFRHLQVVERDATLETELSNIISGLAIAAGIDAPKGTVVNLRVPNAFATGTRPSSTTIGVTSGLMQALSRAELEAVVALLIVQIASRDIALTTSMIRLAGDAVTVSDDANRRVGPAVSWSDVVMRVLTWPGRRVAGWLERKLLVGVGRRRDALAIHYTRNPKALLDALIILQSDQKEITPASRETAPLWVEVPLQPFGEDCRDRAVREALTLTTRIASLRDLAGVPAPAPDPEPTVAPKRTPKRRHRRRR